MKNCQFCDLNWKLCDCSARWSALYHTTQTLAQEFLLVLKRVSAGNASKELVSTLEAFNPKTITDEMISMIKVINPETDKTKPSQQKNIAGFKSTYREKGDVLL